MQNLSQIKYKCEICRQKFKTPTGSTSKRHLDGKKHQNALKRQGVVKQHKRPDLLHEIVLYNAIFKLKNPSYSNILRVFSSFGINSELALNTIIKKIAEKDVLVKGIKDPKYKKVLKIILDERKNQYPISITIEEAFRKFRDLGYKYAPELIDFFTELSHRYPDFLTLSPSKIGMSPDLITFKNIFIDSLKFYPNNNWDL